MPQRGEGPQVCCGTGGSGEEGRDSQGWAPPGITELLVTAGLGEGRPWRPKQELAPGPPANTCGPWSFARGLGEQLLEGLK